MSILRQTVVDISLAQEDNRDVLNVVWAKRGLLILNGIAYPRNIGDIDRLTDIRSVTTDLRAGRARLEPTVTVHTVARLIDEPEQEGCGGDV